MSFLLNLELYNKITMVKYDESLLLCDHDYCPKATIKSRLSEQQSKASRVCL